MFVGKSVFWEVFFPYIRGGNAFFSVIFLTFPIAFVGKTVFRNGNKIASGGPVRGCGWICDFLFFGKFLCKIPYSAQEWVAPITRIAIPFFGRILTFFLCAFLSKLQKDISTRPRCFSFSSFSWILIYFRDLLHILHIILYYCTKTLVMYAF